MKKVLTSLCAIAMCGVMLFTNPLDASARHKEKFKSGSKTFTCWQTWEGSGKSLIARGKTKDSYDSTYANVRVRVKYVGKSYNPNCYFEKYGQTGADSQ